jgi:transposase InsO family protein
VPSASQNKVIVLSVIHGGLSPSQAAARFGVTRQWVHILVTRYKADGDAGLEPRSKKPNSSPKRTDDTVRDAVLQLRERLTAQGLDAGAESIHARLESPPSVSTIWRILKAAQAVTPQPQKRPRSSLIRFEAAQPNETWQSDFTHWPLSDGTDTEIISWLDDHSRYLLHITAHPRITGPVVVTSFTAAADRHGLPASTLTDNGMVYTTRLARGGKSGPNGFESLIKRLGITQKNGTPFHPQTQGKIERFHQTLKKYLAARGPAGDLAELQQQLEDFQHLYNDERPHRALGRRTPATAYTALPKAEPVLTDGDQHWRVRYDTIDDTGTVSVRYAGKLRHLGIGRAHRGKPVVLLMSGPETIIAGRHNAEILAEHTIDPTKDYQPQKRLKPLREEGLQ